MLSSLPLFHSLAELVFTSRYDSVRRDCTRVLLQYLLHYPMGAKRLQQHMELITKNLGCVQCARAASCLRPALQLQHSPSRSPSFLLCPLSARAPLLYCFLCASFA